MFHKEWDITEVEADYFNVQEWEDNEEPHISVVFPVSDYDSAVKYCRENDISINNIVPQKWDFINI